MRPEDERLLRLARILREHGSDTAKVKVAFDMEDWVEIDEGGAGGQDVCPTSCCALGLAALHPEFPEIEVSFVGSCAVPSVRGVQCTWVGAEVMRLFGVDMSTYNSLFMPSHYDNDECNRDFEHDPVKEEEVIDRIRKVLSARGVHVTTRLEVVA